MKLAIEPFGGKSGQTMQYFGLQANRLMGILPVAIGFFSDFDYGSGNVLRLQANPYQLDAACLHPDYHVGCGKQRHHIDHPNAVFGPFCIQPLGQTAHKAFTGGVAGQIRLTVNRRRGGEIDDFGIGMRLQIRPCFVTAE